MSPPQANRSMVAILIMTCCDLEKIIQTVIIAVEHVTLRPVFSPLTHA